MLRSFMLSLTRWKWLNKHEKVGFAVYIIIFIYDNKNESLILGITYKFYQEYRLYNIYQQNLRKSLEKDI